MVTADDKMCCSVVAANDGMEHRLARARHSHGKRDDGKQHLVLWITRLGNGFVGPHSRHVINIARLCCSNCWMEKKCSVNHLDGSPRHLFVSTMHWVTRMEGDDVRPAHRRKPFASLHGREPEVSKVVIFGKLYYV